MSATVLQKGHGVGCLGELKTRHVRGSLISLGLVRFCLSCQQAKSHVSTAPAPKGPGFFFVMRDYSKVYQRFWTGETGKAIRKEGRDCQVVALYLMTCPNSNWLGLYYLPMATLQHETGMSLQDASEALRRASEVGFCLYDDKTEHVWVKEMAFYQIGEGLKAGDKRVTGVVNDLLAMRKCVFYNDFMDKYTEPLNLHLSRLWSELKKPLRTPFVQNGKPFEGLSTFGETHTHTETKTETETETHSATCANPVEISSDEILCDVTSFGNLAEPVSQFIDNIRQAKNGMMSVQKRDRVIRDFKAMYGESAKAFEYALHYVLTEKPDYNYSLVKPTAYVRTVFENALQNPPKNGKNPAGLKILKALWREIQTAQVGSNLPISERIAKLKDRAAAQNIRCTPQLIEQVTQ